MKEKLEKLVNVYRKYGFIGFCRKLYAYVVANYLDCISFAVALQPKKFRRQIRSMLDDSEYDRVILWRSSFGYQVPLFQRPQHIAHRLAENGCLVIYEVTTMSDRCKTIKKQSQRLWLFNFNNILLRRMLEKELSLRNCPKYVQLYSTDWKLSVEQIRAYLDSGYRFIYEYIDHISPALAGTKTLPKNISDKYDFVMSHDDTYVVVTADLLRDDVVSRRGTKHLAFSSNGVDYEFFRDLSGSFGSDPTFQAVLGKGLPVLCYYGALAVWFDYELLKKLAATGRYSIVLFGIKYDGSYDEQLGSCDNVYFLGTRDYSVLKYYAAACDVLMIPFVINDITRSTNPVKLFEYMALHKPIVTTDMNECRKYRSVLIGRDHEEFLIRVEEALSLCADPSYLELLDREAKVNDWSAKARAIIDMIRKDE